MPRASLPLAGAIVALAWANLDRASYRDLSALLEGVVNHLGMAVCFAAIGQQIAAEVRPGGPLHSVPAAALPMAAALGSVLGPALLIVWLTIAFDRPNLERVWAVPGATDVAIGAMAARWIFGAAHAAVAFTYLLGLVSFSYTSVIAGAVYAATPLNLLPFAVGIAAAMSMTWGLRVRAVRSHWAYAVPSVISWLAFHYGGLHPALALMPIVSLMPPSVSIIPQPWLDRSVSVVLVLFALANAGVVFDHAGGGTWFVLAGCVIGKPAGIVAAAAIARLAGLRFPCGVTWRHIVVSALVTGTGLTVGLFVATVAFPYGRLLDETKLGALLGTVTLVLAVVAARVLRVGRFAAR